MRKLYFVIILLYILQSAKAQTPDENWVKENYQKKEFYISMRDGIRLYTAIYIPLNQQGKHPFLLTRTPYSCAPYGEKEFDQRLWDSHWKEYAKEEYIIVIQDVRGRWMSEGEFSDIRPYIPVKKKKTDIDEASDTYDTVDWLLKHISGNNGNVGVLGNSYSGFYSVMAALSGHPAIKAVNPQAPATDWFMGDDFHHNGAFMLGDSFRFYASFGQPRPTPTTNGRPTPVFYTTDEYSFYLKAGALKNLSTLLGDSIRFWQEMMQHPDYDNWWQARDHRRHCHNIHAAILITGGFFDAEDCYGAFGTYKSIATQNPACDLKIVFGPWNHGGWNGENGDYLGNIRFGNKNTTDFYQQQIEIPFFNYHLKGKGNLENMAKATIFFSGENNWKHFNTWPPQNIQTTAIYPAENGKLQFVPPATSKSTTTYTSDPSRPVPYMDGIYQKRNKEYMTADQRFAARRSDVITFQTDPLLQDLTLAGPIIADLKVSISTSDADFIVKIIDVFPDDFKYNTDTDGAGNGKSYLMAGYQMLVRGEIMRGRYRKSFEIPEAFTPGQVTTVRYELPDIAHTFKKGHRLMVQIQSSWFPLADRNPQQFIDIYHCKDEDFITSDITLYHQASEASQLLLPVLQDK